MDSMKFPDAVRYQSCLAPDVVEGRAVSRRYFPTHSGDFEFNGTNEIRIEVTADRGAMLNSSLGYLEFQMKANAKDVRLDGGAWSWIDEMAIICDGQDIERISAYNLLHTVLSQYTSNLAHLLQQNILSGSVYGVNTTPEFASGTTVSHDTHLQSYETYSNVFKIQSGGNAGGGNLGVLAQGAQTVAANGTLTTDMTSLADAVGPVGTTGKVRIGTVTAVLNFTVASAHTLTLVEGATVADNAVIYFLEIIRPNTFSSSGGRGNYDPFLTAEIKTGETKHFCIPIISGFLGSGLYIPLGESRGFTISLRLAQNNMVGVWSGNDGTYTISNPTYNAPIVMIDDAVFRSSFNQMLSGGNGAVCWRNDTYKHYISQVSASPDQTIIINDRSRSLRAMFCVLRTTNNAISHQSRMALSTRTITQIQDFQVRIGDMLYPNTQINIDCKGVETDPPQLGRNDVAGRGLGADQLGLNVSRAYAEVAKIFGMLHNTSAGGLVSIDAFSSDEGLGCNDSGLPTSTTTTLNSKLTHYGIGILGVNLETYEQDSGISGINTARNNLNVTLLLNCRQQTGLAGLTYQVDTYSKISAVYRLDANGTFSVSQ